MSASETLFLMYHEIESPGRPVSNSQPGYVRYVVAEQEFRHQLEAIASAGLHGVSVAEGLSNIQSLARSCIVITFDDGCDTDLLTAAPLLRAAGFNATFFVIAGSIGAPRFLDKQQLLELSNAGFEIGSHSMTHRHLSDLQEDEVRRELQDSKDCIEQIVSRPVVHLSCPNGRWSPRVAQIAGEVGYQTVSTSRIDLNSPETDPSNLARFAVMRDLSIQDFSAIVAAGNLSRYRNKAGVLAFAKKALGNRLYDRLRSLLLRED